MKRVEVKDNYEELSRYAARFVAKKIITNDEVVLGLPTGETPAKAYDFLVEYHQEDLLDFSHVTTFNLDEYFPIKKENEKSFYRYMKEELYDRVNLPDQRRHIPDGTTPRTEVERHCRDYERKISETGGIDLQVLGIGENGHIGFNEPGTELDTETNLVRLNRETVKEKFEGLSDPPAHAITMGIKTIMQSDEILLLASGKRKAEAVERTLRGPVTRDCPASVLQLHPNVTYIVDKEAGAKIIKE